MKDKGLVLWANVGMSIGRGVSGLQEALEDLELTASAGTMKVNSQGNIRSIINESGHYQPTVEQALNYPDISRKAGLNF